MVGVTTTSLFAGFVMVTVACPSAGAAIRMEARTPVSFSKLITFPPIDKKKLGREPSWVRLGRSVAELLDFSSQEFSATVGKAAIGHFTDEMNLVRSGYGKRKRAASAAE